MEIGGTAPCRKAVCLYATPLNFYRYQINGHRYQIESVDLVNVAELACCKQISREAVPDPPTFSGFSSILRAFWRLSKLSSNGYREAAYACQRDKKSTVSKRKTIHRILWVEKQPTGPRLESMQRVVDLQRAMQHRHLSFLSVASCASLTKTRWQNEQFVSYYCYRIYRCIWMYTVHMVWKVPEATKDWYGRTILRWPGWAVAKWTNSPPLCPKTEPLCNKLKTNYPWWPIPSKLHENMIQYSRHSFLSKARNLSLVPSAAGSLQV